MLAPAFFILAAATAQQAGHVSSFVIRHAQCRLCVALQYTWCPKPNGNQTLTDSDGFCTTPEKALSLCPHSLVTAESTCPGDDPLWKQSCTLCTLDSYVWCPKYPDNDHLTEYDGYCSYESCMGTDGTAGKLPQKQNMMDDSIDRIVSVGGCKEINMQDEITLAIALFSTLLWLASTCGCCCLLGGGVFLFFRNLRNRRNSYRRATPWIPPAANQGLPRGGPPRIALATPVPAVPAPTGAAAAQPAIAVPNQNQVHL